MFSHGGSACPFDAVALSGGEAAGGEEGPAAMPRSAHFRNLAAGGDAPAELCRCTPGEAPSRAEARDRSRRLLAKLAGRMTEEVDRETSFNPALPAGYTYIGQLLAHDMVMSDSSLVDPRIAPATLRNHRTERLLLETVYGGGPEVSPFAYGLEAFADESPYRMRLGRVVHGDPQAPESWPLRDIARAAPELLNDIPYIGRWQKLRTTLIADHRNDDNLVLSQLLVLMHIAHNQLCNRVLEASRGMAPDDPLRLLPRDRARVFRVVRKLMIRIWQRIVLKDYLKRLLHPGVYAAYDDPSGPWKPKFDTAEDRRMPVEFSHGAFRMGHAMVRDAYRISTPAEHETPFESSLDDLLNLSSTGTKPDFPLLANWIVRWSHFFAFPSEARSPDGRALPEPQPSRKIAPSVVGAMAPETERSDGYGRGLPYRDLVSAVEIGTRSARSLAGQFARLLPTAAAASRAIPEGKHGLETEIATWISAGSEIFSKAEAEVISSDPPLPFFTLFEAAHEADGGRLGFVGSTVVAETVAVALSTTHAFVHDDPVALQWEARLGLAGVERVDQLCLLIQAGATPSDPFGFQTFPVF